MTKKLEKLILKRRKALINWVNSGSLKDQETYYQLCKEVDGFFKKEWSNGR